MASQAQIDACLANSRKSTGPKTAQGKRIASMNAFQHGNRSRKRQMLREDSFTFEVRKIKWLAHADPANDTAEFLVHQNIAMSFEVERAHRAHLQALRDSIEGAENDQIKEVNRLGRRLFNDPAGHRALYGIRPYNTKKLEKTSSCPDDDDNPGELVKKLESCGPGCIWLISHWEALRARLEPGRSFDSCDKIKAIRLLGAQPVEAIEDQSRVGKGRPAGSRASGFPFPL